MRQLVALGGASSWGEKRHRAKSLEALEDPKRVSSHSEKRDEKGVVKNEGWPLRPLRVG